MLHVAALGRSLCSVGWARLHRCLLFECLAQPCLPEGAPLLRLPQRRVPCCWKPFFPCSPAQVLFAKLIAAKFNRESHVAKMSAALKKVGQPGRRSQAGEALARPPHAGQCLPEAEQGAVQLDAGLGPHIHIARSGGSRS